MITDEPPRRKALRTEFRESDKLGTLKLPKDERLRSRAEAIEIANNIAPENLTIAAGDLSAVRSAGSLFVGEYSPQSAGDYCSGPNHVLPTGGMARVRGGLSVLDFVKLISVQEVSRAGLRGLSGAVTRLAEAEGLQAHADSVSVRCAHA